MERTSEGSPGDPSITASREEVESGVPERLENTSPIAVDAELRIVPKSEDDYRKIIRLFKEENVRHHTFPLPSERNIHAVIRRIPASTAEQEIKEELEQKGYTPIHVIRLKRDGGVPMPLVVVILPKTEKSQQVFNEHELLGLSIRAEVWHEILDAAAAEQYILSMCPLGSQHEHNDSEIQPQNDFQSMWSMPHNENDSTIQLSINDMKWTKKKPSEMDNEATHLMLSLREEKSTYFDDKRTRKLKLWNDVAKELEENNFHLGNKGGERCRQKFADLQKTYLYYMKHQTTTGSEIIDDIPPFFDELHSILGCKHKVNP
ncbi:unnamed protein product [Acanthoscelides obtectus]|uniref:Myb-like domain-containing protein n=1 Tax=Acanthoscelides obtectus TaxID=200917 RepID=A0A9P0LDK7_ACAOB|nr:unnamed protein product [Acanthoscelides obtectus]CAK1624551.1 hypothetical protein AOBTE_LOCUS2604 [Acanthoscelides obtectus]